MTTISTKKSMRVEETRRQYVAIDMKSFYASVECVDRGLDPLSTHLVVADVSRTRKTICLAVSPALKAYGIPGRTRLFEVERRVRAVNRERGQSCGWHFTGKSSDARELAAHPDWELDYVVATPRMARYIEVSAQVYATYLKYVASEDIHVYSIDEVFIDVTPYLRSYGLTARELAVRMTRDVLATTGVTATVGIGTNLYLAKVAMDIEAKHMEPDEHGARVAELDEMGYRHKLWRHRPLTDFWRVGKGVARRLALYGIETMGQIAEVSLRDEDFLYGLFGVNAELLIDHAWGYEPCTMALVKSYRPKANSLGSGQVLQRPYDFRQARVVVREMADSLALDLVAKRKVTDQLALTIGYDAESLSRPEIRAKYHGEIHIDRYGRQVPKHAQGTESLPTPTSSSTLVTDTVARIYDRIVNPDLLIRHVGVTACHVVDEASASQAVEPLQLDLFSDAADMAERRRQERAARDKERRVQEALLAIKRRYGKNAVLRGLNFEEGATGRQRNEQIGGHKA